MKRIIFLDIDGVISLHSDWGKEKDNRWDSYRFNKDCVEILNSILDQVDAEIVLSSDWKKHWTLKEMQEIFEHNGVKQGPVDFTPNNDLYKAGFLPGGRGAEIKQWLKENNQDNDITWVAIDDLDIDNGGQDEFFEDKFVHLPRYKEGIKQTNKKETIIKIMNK